MNPEAHHGHPPEPPWCDRCKWPANDCDCRGQFDELLIGVKFWHDDKQYMKVATDQARRIDRDDLGLTYVTFKGNEQCENLT